MNHGIVGSSTPGDVTRTYEYDPAQPHAATGVVEHAAAAGGNPEVTASESYTYNAVGQTTERVLGGDTQILGWTPEGRVDEVANADDTGAKYLYDADGNRLIARNTVTDEATGEPVTETTLYLGHTDVTVSDAEPTVARATRYVDVGGGHVAVIEDSGAVSFNLADHQGTGQLSIRAADMALTQRRTAPFGADRGEVIAPSDWAGSRGFVGGYDDRETTGLVSLGAREYDPDMGRFISLDPLMDLTDPQQIHGYSYANNSPITLSDPTGLCPQGKPMLDGAYCDFGNGWQQVAPVNTGGATTETIFTLGQSPTQASQEARAAMGSSRVGNPGAAAQGPAEDEVARARAIMDKSITDVALEMGWELLKDFVGWNDLQGCLNADVMSCGMLAMGITPWGKGLKAVKVLYKIIDGAVSFYKKQKAARKILDQVGAACTIKSFTPGTPNSFTPGTLILLADGTKKPIEDIELGDQVLAADEQTGKVTESREVTALMRGEGGKRLVAITIVDTDGEQQEIIATDEHPFWVSNDNAWTDAIDLASGDWLQTAAGGRAQVTAVAVRQRRAVVYNLTVATDHTFFVASAGGITAEAVLSHNARSKMCPHPDATGPHTSFRRDGATGEIDHYESYDRPTDLQDPRPWLTTKRVDVKGKAHYDKKTGEKVPTPHVNQPDGSARAAEPWEIPRRN